MSNIDLRRSDLEIINAMLNADIEKSKEFSNVIVKNDHCNELSVNVKLCDRCPNDHTREITAVYKVIDGVVRTYFHFSGFTRGDSLTSLEFDSVRSMAERVYEDARYRSL